MRPQDFTYWLQGFFELSDQNVTLDDRQMQTIKDHLALVFKKETPTRTSSFPNLFDHIIKEEGDIDPEGECDNHGFIHNNQGDYYKPEQFPLTNGDFLVDVSDIQGTC